MGEADEAAKRVAEKSVSEIANLLGIQGVDATFIVEKATMIIDLLKGGTWKRIASEADAVADKINTLDDAVASARSRK